jgi:hypothetical protein
LKPRIGSAAIAVPPPLSRRYDRRRARVRAALRAAALLALRPRDLALARACRASAVRDAALWPSRFSAFRTGARAARRRRLPTPRAASGGVARRLATALGGNAAFPGRAQLHAGAPRLREADRDRLLGRARTVLTLPDVVHLLAHELARLSGGRLALLLVPLRAVQRLLLWHLGFPPCERGLLEIGAALREAGLVEAVDHVLALPLAAGDLVLAGRDVAVCLAHDNSRFKRRATQ